jgi:hypothetical protein
MNNAMPHTPAWKAFTVLSFIVAVGMLGLGIHYMPTDLWVKGYLAMGALFAVGATANLTKTLRDESEARAHRNEAQPSFAA